MVDVDLALQLAKKFKIPNATRIGLALSFLIFEGFDVEGRVKRWIEESTRKNYKRYNDTRRTS